MDKERVKQIEHGMDMCEALRDYLKENKICDTDEEVVDFIICALRPYAGGDAE